ncbi:RHS repeat domain-containing protein [Pseudoduganella armeniaca]|uniref:RHS repeat domain-containing protein n=1 Tax=Pseudoduganella armeniaca TaxID=2072590 RepID=UPI001C627A98|nr:hypothetical protein [Pseudoduganella armeniaca]
MKTNINLHCLGLAVVTMAVPLHQAHAQTAITRNPHEEQTANRIAEVYENIDKVDPYSGDLTIRQTDVVLKNNGNFNLSLERSYTPSRVFFGPRWLQGIGYNTSHIGSGWGWSFAFAPKVILTGRETYAVQEAPVESYDTLCGAAPQVPAHVMHKMEFPDGRTENFFSDDSGNYKSPSNWKLTCSGTAYKLTSPVGTVYELGSKTAEIIFYTTANNPAYNDENRPAQKLVLNATRITDKMGNWFSIAYTTFVNPKIYKYEDNRTMFTAKLPVRVTSSDGQVLTLNYDAPIQGSSHASPGRTVRLSSVVRSDGATWQYRYSNTATQTYYEGGVVKQVNPPSQIYSMLTEVVRPDGQSWKFSYYDHVPYDQNVDGYSGGTDISARLIVSDKLRSIATPSGGSISYEYDKSEPYAIYDPYYEHEPEQVRMAMADDIFQALRVVKRTTSDGGVWKYSYAPATNANQYDVTRVEGPDGVTQYKHIGVGYFNTDAVNVAGPLFMWGYGTEKWGGAWQVGLLVEKKINDNLTETYDWSSRALGANTVNVIHGRIGIIDRPARVPTLTSTTINLDGAAYTTGYAGYDAFGGAATVTESGPNGGSRVTSRTYNNNTAKWVVGQLKDETYPGSSTLRTFDANGNIASLSKDGVVTSYTYDALGNVATTTFPRGLKHTYSNYKRGIAQTTVMPEQVTLTKVVDDAGNVTSETNGEGKTTTYTFDGLGRMTSTSYPVGNKKTVVYGANSVSVTRGQLAEVTTLDGFGRQEAVSLGGIVTRYSYDPLGRKTFVSNPGGSDGTSYGYDGLGRITEERNADGTSKTITYGAGSQTTRDEAGNITVSTYRSYGNPAQRYLMSTTSAVPAANITIVRNVKDLVTSVTQGGSPALTATTAGITWHRLPNRKTVRPLMAVMMPAI